MIDYFHHISRHLVFWSLIFLALALTTIRFALNVIDIYTVDLENILSQKIGAPVKIGHLGAGMRGFRPELLLKDVEVLGSSPTKTAAINISEIHLSMNLLSTYDHQQLLASSWISLVGAKLKLLRQADGRITISGLSSGSSEAPLWIFQTKQFEILNSSISFEDQAADKLFAGKNSNTPLLFEQVDLLLKNNQNGWQHLLNILVKLPKALGGKLSLSMQLRGNFLAEKGLNGLIYLQGQELQLAKLAKLPLPANLQLLSGQGQLQLWTYWQQSSLQAITGQTELQHIALQKPATPPLKIKHFSNRFNWVKDGEHWRLALDQVALKADKLAIEQLKLGLEGGFSAEQALQRISLDLAKLDMQALLKFAEPYLPKPLPIPAHALQGELEDLSLSLTPDLQSFSIQSDFKQVSLTPINDLPGFSQLSGHIEGNQDQGKLSLLLGKTALALPKLFAQPLPINHLASTISWVQQTENWLFSAPQIELQVPDLSTQNGRLELKLAKHSQQLSMDLHSNFQGSTDIKSFGRYWPVGLMGKDAASWLNQAFLKGQVKPRNLNFKGNLGDFPFNQKPGAFDLVLDFKDIDLHYNRDWEAMHNIDAEVRFHNDSIHIVSQKASVHGSPFEQFDIALPSFSKSPFVSVDLKGQPDIRETLSFLRNSPIQVHVEKLEKVIALQGKAPLTLNIQVPIVADAALKINGNLQFLGNPLTVIPLDLGVKHLQGKLDFNEAGIHSGQLNAETLGDKIAIDIHKQADDLHLNITGHSDIIDLQAQFPHKAWQLARGDSEYHLSLTLPNSSAAASLDLNSDLKGISLRLPDNLAKTPSQARNLSVKIELPENGLMPLTLKLGQQVTAAANFNPKTKAPENASILIGTGKLAALPKQGGIIDINLENCSLMDWWDLVDADEDATKNRMPFFTQINLQAKQLLWQNQAQGPLDLQMHHSALDWTFDINSSLLQGQIIKSSDPSLDKPVLLNLKNINLSQLAQLKANPQSSHTQSRPPLFKLVSDQVNWNGVDIGSLNIDTARIANGLALSPVHLKNGHGALDLDGSWTQSFDKDQTTLSGSFKQRKFGDLLARLKINGDIKETEANINISLKWPAAPHQFALQQLSGQLEVNLNNGRILSIEPGLGRLLGFLAFEQWGRRLRLDFSDMLSKGLTFNNIHGHFALQRGEAMTNDLLVDAVPAEIAIKGNAHLAERTMDYRVKVLPKSSAALPIAGTIVDKVVTFSLETLTGTSQAGFLLGSEYKISGAWENPQIIRQRNKDGLLQKTWDGLTDFSWLRDSPKPKH